MSLTADTAAELRLAGIDPDRLVERRNHLLAPAVDVAARRRQLLDAAAAEYVHAERPVVELEQWSAVDEIRMLDDQAYVRLQHAHPFFYSTRHPIPAASIAFLAVPNPKVVVAVIVGWCIALPLMMYGAGAFYDWCERRGAAPHGATQTLAERLQADQRDHVARWSESEETS